MNKTFYIDEYNSDAKDLYVDVLGKGTVIIKNKKDALAVYIYPFQVVDKPIFSVEIPNKDFEKEN